MATVSTDDDGNRLTDRWECSIPWNSLGSTNGIASITNCSMAGLFANSSVDGSNNRYISGNYLGTSVSNPTNGNYGFNFMSLNGTQIALPSADSDNDGIPDAWELQYFSSLGVADSTSDYDGDGATDYMEYLAGTNPKDPLSTFEARSLVVDFTGGAGYVIRWASVSNRLYDLLKSTNLMTGFDELTNGLPATPPENVFTDAVNGVGMKLYRVSTHR